MEIIKEKLTTIGKLLKLYNVNEDLLQGLTKLVKLENDPNLVTSVDFYKTTANVDFEKDDFPEPKVQIGIRKDKWFKNQKDLESYLNLNKITPYHIDEFELENEHGAHVDLLYSSDPEKYDEINIYFYRDKI